MAFHSDQNEILIPFWLYNVIYEYHHHSIFYARVGLTAGRSLAKAKAIPSWLKSFIQTQKFGYYSHSQLI